MNNKIEADSWFISYNSNIKTNPFGARIEYMLGDEANTKSHRFATYPEAYRWVESLVIMPEPVRK